MKTVKSILKVVSWVVFFISGVLAIIATVCCIGGIIMLFAALFNAYFIDLFAYAAIGFFGSMAVLFLIYLIVSAYFAIEKAVKK